MDALAITSTQSILELAGLEKLHSLAIIGLSKNAGKTTCLNHIIADWQASSQKRPLALTSIGRDGESEDILSGRAKPRIYIPCGTLIATAESALQRCDALLEILELSNIRTSFGEVVLCRALSDGYVELAGPATADEMDKIAKLVRQHEADCLFIIDGALSRRSQAGSGKNEAIILAVSAETSANPKILADRTKFALEILQSPGVEEEIKRLILATLSEKPRANVLSIIEKKDKRKIKTLETPSLVGFGNEIADQLKKGTTYLFLRGAVTDQVIIQLLKEANFRDLTLIAEDGTRLFLKPETIRKLQCKGIELAVLNSLDVRLVCLNPTRSNNQLVDSEKLLLSLQEAINVPVADFGPANM